MADCLEWLLMEGKTKEQKPVQKDFDLAGVKIS